MKLLVSLHDVTPFHLQRLQKAEALCCDLGVDKITYLLIPNYHSITPSDQNAEFVAWCRNNRAFKVEWLLHGYTHLDDQPAAVSLSVTDRLRRRFLTGNEGEFLPLDTAAQRRRIAEGLAIFRRCLERDPSGFVAPAWLFNDKLFPILCDNGLRYTEDHRHIFFPASGGTIKSPVITWATRSVWRKQGSLIAAPLLAHRWRREAILRIAIHPFDFDHGETVKSIRRTLSKLMEGRDVALPSSLDLN